MSLRLGVLATHPIQNHAPIFRELAKACDLTVFFAHRQTPEGQAAAGFGVPFEWDVDLLAGYESEFLNNRSTAPATNRFFGCDTPEIVDRIEKGRFDAFMVTGWGVKSYWQAVFACRKVGTPIMIRGDSQLPARRSLSLRVVKRAMYPRALRLFDGFLYVGRRNREYLAHYGVPDGRLFFSPHCVDNALFASKAGIERMRLDTLTLSSTAKSVLFVGKLVERKRPLDFVRGMALVRERGCDACAIFVGAGELHDGLRREAARLGVPAVFHGFQNQSRLPAFYASNDLLVLPSDHMETWGLVVNEAMACGVPAVVSDAVGCGPDLIDSGRTGAVFPLGNLAALAEAIRATLELQKADLRVHLSKKVEAYSPARAAHGIIEGAEALC